MVNAGRNVVELGVPMAKWELRKRKQKKAQKEDPATPVGKEAEDEVAQIVREIDDQVDQEKYGMPELAFDGTIDDYLELAISFGFLVLFSVTFPAAGVLTFLSSIFEMYVDSYKLRHIVRRPVPQPAVDIGVWENIFVGITMAGIVTNATIIVWTAKIDMSFFLLPFLGEGKADNPYVAFVFIIIVLLLIKVFLQDMAGEDPNVAVADQRMKHVLSTLKHLGAKKEMGGMQEEKCDFNVKRPEDLVLQGRWGEKKEEQQPKSAMKKRTQGSNSSTQAIELN